MIEWHGGENPVKAGEVLTKIFLANGEESRPNSDGNEWDWSNGNAEWNIVGYTVTPDRVETRRGLDYVGEQIIAMKSEGVACIVINHQYIFDVSLIYLGDGKLESVRGDGATLSEAYKRADLSRQRRIAEARQSVNVAESYAVDWGFNA